MKTTDQPQVKQYVIYSRKSKFTGKGESIENQIELCRQYIAMHFGEDEAEHALVYEDEGFSGGNLERPQFKQMMKDSQKIEFAAIVVYRLDRISRNIGDFAKLIEDLGDRHIDFISIREQFDTSSPMGRAMMYIASVFSQLERETIAERIRDNMHELSKTGRWLGGTTPTGYASESLSSVTVDGKVKKACKLKPIPEEIQLVKTIFSVFTESGSLSKTDQYLLEHRCVTKRGKQFTRFAIRGILTNPVYMIADDTAYQYLKENNVDLFAEPSEFDGEHGIMAYNRTLQRPGKATQIRPMEDWIVAVGKHPGIISGANWVRVQSMLDVNKSKSYRRPRSNVALLSGLLRCGECGDYMRPKLTGRTNANGELIYTYMCSTKERSHGTVCSMKNCNGNTLDAKIVEEIRKVATDKKDFGQLLSKTKKVINDNKASYEAELTLLVKNHAETEARIKRLVESLSVASETSAKYVMEQIDELHRQSEQEQTRIAELEKLARQSNALSQNLFFYRDMIESFADTVDSTTIEERRRLLRTIVKKVVWDGKNVYVYLFAEDGELNLPPIGQLMCPSGEDSECYPLRMTAYKSLLDRAKIGGTALPKLGRDVLAETLNACLHLYSAEALLLIRDEKIAAVHSGDPSDYSVLPINELLSTLTRKLDERFPGAVFESGYTDHSCSSATWTLPGQKDDLLGAYAKVLKEQGKSAMAAKLMPGIRFMTSDTGVASAKVSALLTGLQYPIHIGGCIAVDHRHQKKVNDFENALDQLFAQFGDSVAKLEKLLDIELEYPVNAMTRICKKLSLPKKAAVEAIAMFEMSYGGGSATAHDVFMALQEIPFILKSQNTPESKMLVIEENMARALTLKWSDYDLAKAVSY